MWISEIVWGGEHHKKHNEWQIYGWEQQYEQRFASGKDKYKKNGQSILKLWNAYCAGISE